LWGPQRHHMPASALPDMLQRFRACSRARPETRPHCRRLGLPEEGAALMLVASREAGLG
jgi:hypothetical protein